MVKRQRTAFPPNFVHSLDGSHMMMTAVASKKAGLNFAGLNWIPFFFFFFLRVTYFVNAHMHTRVLKFHYVIPMFDYRSP